MLGEVIEALRVLEDPREDGESVAALLRTRGARADTTRISGERGHTDVVRARFGERGPCLGILGVLGGTGMRPERPGLVSDADGAVVALAVALALARQWAAGDALPGSIHVATHVCPRALVRAQHPAPMMSCPADRVAVLDAMMDVPLTGILSVDAAKANRVLNRTGFALTPPSVGGWVLRPSDDLLDLQSAVTGEAPVVFPLTMGDITPYGSGARHVNSIMQPATRTAAPVVGVAITAASTTAGSATGANQPFVLDGVARFCVEVARAFTAGRCRLHDEGEHAALVARYGPMTRLQSL